MIRLKIQYFHIILDGPQEIDKTSDNPNFFQHLYRCSSTQGCALSVVPIRLLLHESRNILFLLWFSVFHEIIWLHLIKKSIFLIDSRSQFLKRAKLNLRPPQRPVMLRNRSTHTLAAVCTNHGYR